MADGIRKSDSSVVNSGQKSATKDAATEIGAKAKGVVTGTRIRELEPGKDLDRRGVPKTQHWSFNPFKIVTLEGLARLKGLRLPDGFTDAKHEAIVTLDGAGPDQHLVKIIDPQLNDKTPGLGFGEGPSKFSNEYPAEKWFVVTKAPPKPPADPNAPKVPFAEKLPLLIQKYAQKAEKHEERFKRLLADLDLPGTDDTKELWARLLELDKAAGPQELSSLDKLAYAAAGFVYTKNGTTDLDAVNEKAPMVKAMLLAEADRNLREDALSPEDIGKIITRTAGTVPQGTTLANIDGFLEKIAGGKFVASPDPIQFGNGQNEASLAKREVMIKNSKYEVDYDVWKMAPTKDKRDPLFETEGDVGTRLRKALVDAATGADGGGKRQVRVMVDGNVAARDEGALRVLKELEVAGVQVIPYFDPENPLHGMHSKGLYIDCSASAIAKGAKPTSMRGGRNAQNEYMIDGRWSDSDHYFEGAGAAEGYAAHAKLWNRGAALAGRSEWAISQSNVPTAKDFKKLNAKYPPGDTKVLSVADIPAEQKFVIPSLMAATIGAASKGDVIHLQHAYLFGVPGIEESLVKAMGRGAKIIGYTNSSKTTDLGPVADLAHRAFMERMKAVAKPGQLREFQYDGTGTMHDKVMFVESQDRKRSGKGGLVFGGSFNPHGRLALEAENLYVMSGDVVYQAALANNAKLKSLSKEVEVVGLTPKEHEIVTALKLKQLFRPHL